MQLRDYQKQMIADLACETCSNRVCAVSATGSGKAAVIAHVARYYVDRNKRVLILANRKVLVEQLKNSLWDWVQLEVGGLCKVTTVQAWARNPSRYPTDIMIVDEGHYMSKEYFNVAPETKIIGFTATPVSGTNSRLGLYTDLVVGPQTRDLIDRKILSPFRHHVLHEIQTTGVRVVNGDFDAKALGRNITDATIEKALSAWRTHSGSKSTILFAPTIDVAERVISAFCEAGGIGAIVTGRTPEGEREDLLTDLSNGILNLLVNVNCFVAGLDIPSIDCVVMLRPTKSLSLYLQSAGRGLRLAPGKEELTILDFTDNRKRLGAIDQLRDWVSIWENSDDRPKSEEEEEEERQKTTELVEIEQVDYWGELNLVEADKHELEELADEYVRSRDRKLLYQVITRAQRELPVDQTVSILNALGLSGNAIKAIERGMLLPS
jgi:superfamily II DNA or RNA helicase